ncbi:helix-turn-helix transcriptional regulator [Sulfitobacter sp.]|uniref:helix-turn-helix transcriptional regulator n=1 Tax=Sulfitobacter sp. TaxID=1903071 RepID=UPI0030018E4B
MENPFEVSDATLSYAVPFKTDRSAFTSESEPAGQLVLCQSGEIELSGHDGEWIIPAGYMVYVPAARMFRIRVRFPSSGNVIKFCRDEVSWNHNGCWVGQVQSITSHLSDYALKWSSHKDRTSDQAKAFFVTVGEMVPNWFQHERFMWTPYAENSSIQRVIDFTKQSGPDISLPEVAAHVGMSERNLRRHMQSELGQSWRDFIRELRMNKAMVLLGKDRKSVTETAFEVGFSSSSAFSSAFMNYVGKTPSAFVKTIRNKPERVAQH